MNENLILFKKTFQNHGVVSVLNQLAMNSLNKIFPVKVLTCISLAEINPSSLIVDAKFQHGFLTHEELIQYSQSKRNELPDDFLSQALQKGDQCYAVTDSGSLAGYGWYSNTDTLTDIYQLKFSFHPSYVYMYKGLTNNDYRGQRLHAVGMGWALKSFLNQGYHGIVSYVESTNYDSLKSCYRLGYKKIGFIVVTKIFGKVFHLSSKSCQKLNIKLQC